MSGYIGPAPVPQATQTRQTFTATSGQTSFATIGYVAGGQFIQVYLNGVLLKLTDDYTAANGSDIVLTSGAATGDIFEFISFADFTVNNQNFTGGLTVDNDGSTVLTVDRATSDGTIIDVQKSGSSVGSIGTQAGTLQIDGTSGSTGLLFGASNIYPRDNGANSDGGVDIGGSSIRFKDLYLSGGVYLGGVGSANKISDYETGTWTPTSSLGTITVQETATYTKIGNLVTVYADLRNFSEQSNTSAIRINGLPFTSAKRSVGAVMQRYISNIPTNGGIVAYIDSVNYVNFLSNGGNTNWRGTQYADINSSAAILSFTITYRV